MPKDNAKIVPFGKYKGQPVAVMAEDQQYCDWLMQQSWFRDNHKNLYTIIINNFAEPSETPEHNKLQALFLNDDFLKNFTKLVLNPDLTYEVRKVEFECRGFDAVIQVRIDDATGLHTEILIHVEIKPSVGDDYPAVLRQIGRARAGKFDSYRRWLERPAEHCVLLIDAYVGAGVTEEEFIQIFGANRIKIVKLGNVTAPAKPPSRKHRVV
jgi:hypothetical protein